MTLSGVCPHCNGRGTVKRWDGDPNHYAKGVPCPDCNGTGRKEA